MILYQVSCSDSDGIDISDCLGLQVIITVNNYPFDVPSFKYFCFICKAEVLFWPVFVIATLAAMIASQAMISATFSCIKQAMALGCFPRIKIIHTSKKVMGQIYIPVMNWFLMVMCIIIVATFRSTNDIANAYGQCFCLQGIYNNIFLVLASRMRIFDKLLCQ